MIFSSSKSVAKSIITMLFKNTKENSMKKIITFIMLYCLVVNQSMAAISEVTRNTKYNVNSASEYIFEAYPNQELIPIRLLGAIKNAGLYHIPANMKLITLLSLAGGTTNEANLENILVGNDQLNSKSRSINLEDTLKNGATTDYTLISNDIILVQNKTPLISNDSFRVITVMSLVLTSILTLVVIRDRSNK
jgi:hypothetical protein